MQLEIKRLHRELGIIDHLRDARPGGSAGDVATASRCSTSAGSSRSAQPTELYERPATRFVADFIGESNIFPGVAESTVNGFCTVGNAGMHLRATATRPLTPGARAVVSVRPERIALQSGEPSAGMENVIGGRVTDVVYLGRSRKYVIRTDAGQEVISVQQARSGAEPGYEIGSAVSLRWQAEDATVLPDQVQG